MNTTWKDILLFINGLTPDQQDLPAVCYHDYEEDYQPVSCLRNDDSSEIDTPVAYLMFTQHGKTPYLNATWVSEWEYGIEIRSACHYDSVKNIVDDIQPTDVQGLDVLLLEYVELQTGKTIGINDLSAPPY